MLKHKSKHFLIFTLIGLLLTITVGLSVWIITNKIIIKPDLDAEKVIIKYLDNNEATYDGNILLPSSAGIGLTYESEDLIYYYKLKDSEEEYKPVDLDSKAGPINVGVYQIKVIYKVTNDTTENIEGLVFTINKATIDMSLVKFNTKTVTYDKQNHMINIDGTLPTQIKSVSYYCNDKVFSGAINSGTYSVKAVFEYDTVNYNTVNDLTATLIINPKNIGLAKMSFKNNDKNLFKYTGNEISDIKNDFVLTDDDNTTLINGVDYTVGFSELVKIGSSHTITVEGIGNYTGELKGTYIIIDTTHILVVKQDSSKIDSGNQWEELTYNGEDQKPSLIITNEDGDLISDVTIEYEITQLNRPVNESIHYGMYTMQVTVSKDGYTSATCKAYLFIVAKAVSIKWSETTSFIYNGSPQAPTAEVVDGLVEGDKCLVVIDTSTKQINAGTDYVAKVSHLIDEESNQTNYDYKVLDDDGTCIFDIRKADLSGYTDTVELSYTSPYIQGNEVDVETKSGYTLNGVTKSNGIVEQVNCSITNVDYSRALFNINNADKMTSNQTIWITFTPENTNYNNYTYKTSIEINAVATIGSTYYGTVEAAIKAAVSGNEIFLIAKRNPVLRSNSTIKSGVTLNLVYENNKFNNNRESASKEGFADRDEASIQNYLQNTLTIASGVELTNYGTINIDGVVGSASVPYAGQTSGYYTQIVMGSNAIINSYDTIYCLGYIKEESAENGSQVNINKGTISAPFVIYDFRGGSISYALNKNEICPFKIFDIPNVQSLITIKYGAKYEILVDIYANNSHYNQDDLYLIGDNSSSLFILSKGDITIKYHNKGDYKTSTMDININGTCTSGGLIVKIPVLSYISADINTADYYCPISNKFKININSGSTFNFSTKFEFMPGAEVIIHENAIANINANTIFYVDYAEPSDANYIYNATGKPAAKLLVHGTCNITAEFSGIIVAGNDNAILYIEKNQCTNIKDGADNATSSNALFGGDPKYATSEEVTLDGSGTLIAKGLIGTGSNENTQFEAGGFYVSKDNCWISQASNENKYTVIYHYYDINGNEQTTSKDYYIFEGITPSFNVISVENRKYYTSDFDSWVYRDDSGNELKYNDSSIVISKGKTYDLYLIDEMKNYTINYIDVNGKVEFDSLTINIDNFSTVSILSPDNTEDRTFVGWYYTNPWTTDDTVITPGLTGESNIKAIIDVMEDQGITELTLYGKYTTLWYVYFIVNNDEYTESISSIQVENGNQIVNLDSISNKLIEKEIDTSFTTYFIGWYTNKECTSEFNSDSKIESDITLYAKWEEKIVLEYSDGITWYVTPGSTIKLKELFEESDDYKIKYTYKKWVINGSKYDENAEYQVPDDVSNNTISAEADHDCVFYYKVTIENKSTGNKVTKKYRITSITGELFDGETFDCSESESITVYIKSGSTVNIEIRTKIASESKFTVTVYDLSGNQIGNSITQDSIRNSKTLTFTMPSSVVTVSTS